MDKLFTVRVVYEDCEADDFGGKEVTPNEFEEAYSKAKVKAAKLGKKIVGIFFRLSK